MIPLRPLLLATLALFAAAHSSTAQPVGGGTGGVVHRTRTSQSDGQLRAVIAESLARRRTHVIVQFTTPPKRLAQTFLSASGMTLLQPLGGGAYFAVLDETRINPEAIAATPELIAIEPVDPQARLHEDLAGDSAPAGWVLRMAGGRPVIPAYVLFHRDVSMTRAAALTVRVGGVVVDRVETIHGLVVELPFDRIATLAEQDEVMWIEPPLRFSTTNDAMLTLTQADIVQESPYGLDGTGVIALVYDGGVADVSHPDFGGRLIAREGADVINHSTHVAATLGGSGQQSDGQFRGVAPGVNIESYSFTFIGGSGELLYSNPGDIEENYDEAINTYGADLASNSIGSNVCVNDLIYSCSVTGNYGATSALIDNIVAGSLGLPFRIVWSNGNERNPNCTRCVDQGVVTPEGFHSTSPPACAKNHISVGAVNADTDEVTNFSSFGPCDDGRLKPDLVAPGCQTDDDFGVTSAAVGGGYISFCGSSMATPTVAGAVALMLQDIRAQFPELGDPRNSTFKALLAHTAQDLGSVGPDCQSGYGSMRVQDAIDFLRTGQFTERQVEQSGVVSFFAVVDEGDDEFKVTLAWDDVAAAPNPIDALVNDLDLIVTDPLGNVHYPWTLDPDNPGDPAVQSQPDRTNNIEQVFVSTPLTGLWNIEVVGFNIAEGPQPFSLCTSSNLSNDCNGNGIPDDEEIAADPSLDCADNGVIDSCEPDCDGDSMADSCEMATGASTDCNANDLPDDCEPFVDCDGNGVLDACDVADGAGDCNGNFIPDVCEPGGDPEEVGFDCNDNGVPDFCDIETGANDFNFNGVPDECEATRVIIIDTDHANCSDDGEGTAGEPFCTIQGAIDDSIAGDLIDVAPGTYKGPGNRNIRFGGRAITVRCMGQGECIVDAENFGGGFIFDGGESPDARLEGMVIQHGVANYGAGVRCTGSSPTLVDCTIRDNIAALKGGGLFVLNGSPTISRCAIRSNKAVGGIFSGGFSGGGVYLHDSPATINNCIVSDNEAFFFGGGIFLQTSEATIRNCTIADNRTAAAGSVGNFGGGVYCNNSSPTIENTILWGNTASTGAAVDAVVFSSPMLSYCVIEGGAASLASDGTSDVVLLSGNVNADPVFSDSEVEEPTFTLLSGSPCINHGDPAFGSQAGELDAHGQPRVRYGRVDIGAVEFFDSDCDGSGVLDEQEIAQGLLGDCNNDGLPDLCEPGCNANGVPDSCDLLDGSSLDCDENLVPDECDTAGGIEDDCDGNAVPDSCDVLDGAMVDCNDNLIPDVCEAGAEIDCNLNGAPDFCDVFAGVSVDCDGNGIPDECTLADGSTPDCNENSVPDTCDIVAGESADCDANGVPDECEDCNGNGVGDACDIEAGVSADCNLNGQPDECESGAELDCNDNGSPDFCDIFEELSEDCDGNGVPDECEDTSTDCNGNGIWDACDIADGTSEDFNDNAVPDECEAEGVTYYVDDDAPDDPGPGDVTVSDPFEDGSAAHPFDAIQKAIDTSLSGDTIVVRDGHYAGAGNRDLNLNGRSITIRSEQGPWRTTISCEFMAAGIVFDSGETPNAVVEGIRFFGCASLSGGALQMVASEPTIRNCILTRGSSLSSGGAVTCKDGAAPLIEGCLLHNNTAAAGAGIAVLSQSEPQIINCTITDNKSSGAGGGIYVSGDSNPVVTNCVVWANSAKEGRAVHVLSGAPVLRHCSVEGGWPGENNLDLDPVFVDSFGSNFHLSVDSPCIDAGDPATVGMDLFDMDGYPRVLDGAGNGDAVVDIGADERPFDCPVIVFSDPAAGTIDARQPFEPDGSNPAGFSEFALTYDVDLAELSPYGFAVTQISGRETAPVVQDVVMQQPEQVVAVLDKPLELGTWATLIDLCSGMSVRVGFLPGDVDTNKTVTSTDLLTLIDAVNGIGDLSYRATDMNRDGVLDEDDILRAIDLLTGVDEYPELLGKSLPMGE